MILSPALSVPRLEPQSWSPRRCFKSPAEFEEPLVVLSALTDSPTRSMLAAQAAEALIDPAPACESALLRLWTCQASLATEESFKRSRLCILECVCDSS